MKEMMVVIFVTGWIEQSMELGRERQQKKRGSAEAIIASFYDAASTDFLPFFPLKNGRGISVGKYEIAYSDYIYVPGGGNIYVEKGSITTTQLTYYFSIKSKPINE